MGSQVKPLASTRELCEVLQDHSTGEPGGCLRPGQGVGCHAEFSLGAREAAPGPAVPGMVPGGIAGTGQNEGEGK